MVTNYIMNNAITYNISELAFLANVITDPGVLVVNNDSPYKTFKQFVSAAKKQPGQITVGNSGVGGDDFFSTILIAQATGAAFKRIPFQGDGPSYTAALSGKVDASSNNLSIVYSQIKAGKLRALAVYSDHRLKQLPDVPTLEERGVDVVSGSSRGFAGPADMPEKTRQQFIAAVDKMARNPEFQKQAAAQGLNIDIKTGRQYRSMIEHMSTQYTQVWNSVKDQVRN